LSYVLQHVQKQLDVVHENDININIAIFVYLPLFVMRKISVCLYLIT